MALLPAVRTYVRNSWRTNLLKSEWQACLCGRNTSCAPMLQVIKPTSCQQPTTYLLPQSNLGELSAQSGSCSLLHFSVWKTTELSSFLRASSLQDFSTLLQQYQQGQVAAARHSDLFKAASHQAGCGSAGARVAWNRSWQDQTCCQCPCRSVPLSAFPLCSCKCYEISEPDSLTFKLVWILPLSSNPHAYQRLRSSNLWQSSIGLGWQSGWHTIFLT